MTSRRRLVLPALAVAAGLALAGCGSTEKTLQAGSSATTTPPITADPAAEVSAEHNEADVAFVAAMIAHHQQAITLADQALDTSDNDELKQFATNIKQAQSTEITTMRSWLTAWGVQSTAGADDAHGSDDHSAPESTSAGESTSADGAAHEGMLTDDELTQLAGATGVTYDKLWLDLMIKHHEGAVASAQAQLAAGSNAEVQALAQSIIDEQTAEVTELKALRSELG